MNRRRSQHFAALAATLPLGACAYLEQRAADLHDCVIYRWHQDALGIAAEAKVGPLALTLGGWYAEQGTGKDTWWQSPGSVLTNHGTGVPFTTLGPVLYDTSLSRVLVTGSWGNCPRDPRAFDDVRSWLLLTDTFDLDDGSPFRPSAARQISDLFGVEIGVVPVLVGLHVGFNVAEFADALLGFVGLDVFGDDGVPRPATLPFVPRERG